MKNDEIILKYLSDLMDEDEKKQFEIRLGKDQNLKNDFESINNKLNTFTDTNVIETDSSYFINLMPKMRNKIERKERNRILTLAPIISFGVAALLIFFLQLPKIMHKDTPDNYAAIDDLSSILSDLETTYLNDYFEGSYIYDYAYYDDRHTGDIFDLYLNQQINIENGFDLRNGDYIDQEISVELNDFSDEEIGIIYEELLNKKIL